jgi:hypothetical protein
VSESVPPPDPDLLGPLRQSDPAPDAVRARARGRLMAGGGALPKMPRSAAFLLGSVIGMGLHSAIAPAPAPWVIYVDRVAPAAPAAPAADAPVAVAVPEPLITSSASTAQAAPSSSASRLSAQRIAVDQARAALGERDPERGER